MSEKTQPARVANLPVVPYALVGRKRETQIILSWLAEERLITLTGPSGIGKSRLAAHIAQLAASRFSAGAWWCDLSSLTDPALVAEAVSAALDLRRPTHLSLAELAEAMGRQSRLLVMVEKEIAGLATAGYHPGAFQVVYLPLTVR